MKVLFTESDDENNKFPGGLPSLEDYKYLEEAGALRVDSPLKLNSGLQVPYTTDYSQLSRYVYGNDGEIFDIEASTRISQVGTWKCPMQALLDPNLGAQERKQVIEMNNRLLNEFSVNPADVTILLSGVNVTVGGQSRESDWLTNINFIGSGPESFKNPDVVLVYSHGGSVREQTTAKSLYLPTILAVLKGHYGLSALVIAPNHAGSYRKNEYQALGSRYREILVADLLAQELKSPRVWAGISMGGHTVANLSSFGGELPSGVLLMQPAAYSEDADKAADRQSFSTAIRRKATDGQPSWTTSPSFNSLGQYVEKGGKARIIMSIGDSVIPTGVIKMYMSLGNTERAEALEELDAELVQVASFYQKHLTFNTAVGSLKQFGNGSVDMKSVPGSHVDTTAQEIVAICDFIKGIVLER